MLTKNQIDELIAAIENDPNVLRSAQNQANAWIHPDGKNLDVNCCAATLSYELIDIVKLPLKRESEALTLSCILQTQYGMNRVNDLSAVQPGDIGVVNYHKPPHLLDDLPDDGLFPDGDCSQTGREFAAENLGPCPPGQDPNNIHHIYLVMKTGVEACNPDVMLIADNHGASHNRSYLNRGQSPTLYFLRAGDA